MVDTLHLYVECLYFKNRSNGSFSRGSCLRVINDYQSAAPTWILSRMVVRRVGTVSTVNARRDERWRGDAETEEEKEWTTCGRLLI